MSADQRKDLPPASSPGFLDAVREVLSVYLGKRGDPLNRGVTLRDLSDAGMVELSPGYLQGRGGRPPIVGPGPNVGSGGEGGAVEPDLTPPPMPSGVIVAATFSALIMQHAAPIYPQGHGHARTKVYGAIRAAGAPQPVFGDAVEITQFVGNIFAHPTTLGTTWHLWFTWISQDGVESTVPAGGANGFVATTGRIGNADLGPLIVEAGNLAAAAVDLGSSKVTGTITDPARFGAVAVGYTVTQYLVATSGLLANLRVDDAQMVSVSADKLLAGAIQVGRHIQSADFVPGTSGWVIRGDGTAEFAAASIRGKLTANQIDGKGLEIRDNAGNLILGAGNALALGYVPPGALNSNVGGVNLAFGSQLSGSAGPGVYGVGLGILYDYYAGYNPFSIKAGDVFTISAEVWQDGASAAAGQIAVLYLYCANYLGTWVAQAAVLGAGQTSVGARSSATLTVHPDTVIIGWAVYHQLGSTNTVGTALADRVQVERGSVATQYKPGVEPGATRGATFGVNIGGQITPGNVSTFIADAAIGAAQVGSLTVGVVSNAVNGGAGSGQNRIVMNTNEFVFYNASNVARIRMIP